MSAAFFAQLKELTARVRTLESEVALLKDVAKAPPELPKKAKAA